jgi:hypothetical protein
MVFGEMERIGENAVMEYLNVVCRHLPGGAEGNHEKF